MIEFAKLIEDSTDGLQAAMDRHTGIGDYEPAIDVLLQVALIKAILALAVATRGG